MSNFRRHLMGVIATQRQYIEGYCQPGTSVFYLNIQRLDGETTDDQTRYYSVTPDANGYWRWYVPQGRKVLSLRHCFSRYSQANAESLLSVDLSHIDPVISLEYTFGYYSGVLSACTNLKSVKGMRIVSDSSIEAYCFNGLFYNCSSLEYVDVHGWKNTAKGLYFTNVFRGCSSLPSIDGQDEWELRVRNHGYAFQECNLLDEINMHNFVGNSNSIGYFAYNCNNVKNIDLGSVTFPNAPGLAYSFYHCYDLESLDLSGLTGNTAITTLGNAFNGCQTLEEIDLSMLGTCQVTNMAGVFNGCLRLKRVYGLNKLDVSNCTTFASMCFQCRNLEDLDIHTWSPSHSSLNFASTFRECFAMKINASTVPDFSGATASRVDYLFASGSLSVQQQWEADTGRTAWADFTHISIPTIPEGATSNNFTTYQYRATTVTTCGDISNGISLSYSPIDLPSAILVLQHLQDVTGYGGKTLTFSTTTRALIAGDATAMSLVQNARDNLGWTITI